MARFTIALFALIACFFLSASATLATATKCPTTPTKMRPGQIACFAIMEVTVYYKNGTTGTGEGGCVNPCSNPEVEAWEPMTVALDF